MTRKDIEGAILSTLVIKNKGSLKYAVDNIVRLSDNDGVICVDCKQVISTEDINNHRFMKITEGGLIHWKCPR